MRMPLVFRIWICSAMVLNSFNMPPYKIRGPLAVQRPSFVPASHRVHKDYFTGNTINQVLVVLGDNSAKIRKTSKCIQGVNLQIRPNAWLPFCTAYMSKFKSSAYIGNILTLWAPLKNSAVHSATEVT